MGIRKHYRARMLAGFFVRFHVFLILAATVAAGLGSSRALAAIGVDSVIVRPLLAVSLAYGFFFVLIRLWLVWLRLWDARTAELSARETDGVSDDELAEPPPKRSRSSGDWDLGGLDFSLGEDPISGAIGILLLVVALIGFAFVAGSWVLIEAPLILVEAAFQFALAASLVRAARAMDAPGWAGSVLKRTIVPFLIVLAITAAVGILAATICPGTTRIMACFAE